MKYDINKLPDFYSVRNYEQINYALEGLENKKCLAFFDNGFTSNIIEPNKRDIKFIWDGFLVFVDQNITLEDIRNGKDLFDSRLVALQRTKKEKFNSLEARSYIIDHLKEKEIPLYIMPDKKEVDGYPSKCDLWSTRDETVLIDAATTTGDGPLYYYKNTDFNFDITFNQSMLPTFSYQHRGALVLKGENESAIARLLANDLNLNAYIEKKLGTEKIFSTLEKKELPGTRINNLVFQKIKK